MNGPDLDPRTTPARDDIAAAELAGRVSAARFVTGTAERVTGEVVDLRREADMESHVTDQLLFGETFTVYDRGDGWCWGQSHRDNYVGYCRSKFLTPDMPAASHRVAVPRTPIFPEPDPKSPTRGALPMNAQVRAAEAEGRFRRLSSGGWVVGSHLADFTETASDFVAVAELFLGAPYVWGGNSWTGLDCSGLVQMALLRAGLPCPRDSDHQETELGQAVDPDGGYRRGDLVFFPGHVGVMTDGETLLHANAFHMMVAKEPLAEAEARIREQEGIQVTSVRRLG